MKRKKLEVITCPWKSSVKIDKIILGIDPGVNGAFSVIHGDRVILCDFPKININNKPRINLPHLKELLFQVLTFPCTAYIEDVHSMPKQGVTSMFTFGYAKGQLEGLCIGLGIDVHMISPQKWKRYFNLSGESDTFVKRTAAQFIDINNDCSMHQLEALLLSIAGYSLDSVLQDE